MVVALILLAPVHADEPDRPLAIPELGDGRPKPPAIVLKPVEPEGLGVSAERMAEFQDRRLRVLPAERRGAGYTLGPTDGELDFAAGVNAGAVQLAPRLVVAQGERLLGVPTLMDTLGDNPTLLRERIDRKQWTANAWTAVSALGLVGAAVAFRLPYEERGPWLLGSASMITGGLVFGGNAQRRANRLQRDLDLEYDRRELLRKVRLHNEALATELGVDPDAESVSRQ